MKICIVGAGTAGLITALVLKLRFKTLEIEIIKSDKIGIIGVGEGTTEHWKQFTDFCNIGFNDLIKKTDATLKYGVMFEDWTDHTYFHNIIGQVSSIKFGQYQAGYIDAIINNLTPPQYTSDFCWENKIATDSLANQLHFNTFKLNDFLLNKCKSIGITIIEDEIADLKFNDFGDIDYLFNKDNKKYKSDFYIDCTGFKRLLIGKMGAKWISYSKHLPMNEAIAFPTADTNTYTPYTLAKAMTSGWMWRIPTQGRWGNGYVFNNNYINADQAKKECEDYLGYEVHIGKNIKFEAGALDKAWIKNCVAVGLSSSFIEPLEASSIGTTIQQAFILIHKIINYKKTDIDSYNVSFTRIVENIRDFVVLHYITNKKDSPFWKELQLNLPQSLADNLLRWKHKAPMVTDFPEDYSLFKDYNFILILKELNLVDKDSYKKEFESLSQSLQDGAKQKLHRVREWTIADTIIDHKQYLNNIINEK